jgi:hypothetical protein
MNFLKSITKKIVKSDLELKLSEAVSEDSKINYFQLVEEISIKTNQSSELQVVLNFIFKKLNSKKIKKVVKTLKLIQFLLKSANFNFITQLKIDLKRISVLVDYPSSEPGAEEIKEKARQIIKSLTDTKKLSEERDLYVKSKLNSNNSSEQVERISGGILNRIGSFDRSSSGGFNSGGGFGTYGLGAGSSANKAPGLAKPFGENNTSESEEESEEEDDDNKGKYKKSRSQNVKVEKDPKDFEFIFSQNEQNKQNKGMNILEMNDLFTQNSSNKIQDVNDIFDFTKK